MYTYVNILYSVNKELNWIELNCAKVKSLQYLQRWQNSINLFVSFSKKASNVKFTTHSEKKRRTLFAFVYSPWSRKFLCRFSQSNAVNSGYDRGERCSCAVFFALLVNWLAWTLLKRFAFLFSSINKLLFIRQNCMSCEEIPSSENSDKPASSILICSRKHCFERIKVSESKSLHKKWRCLNTIKSCFTFKIIDTRIFSYFQKVLTLTLWQNTQFTTVILFCFIFTS